jgi:hypothetical protein
MEKMYKTYGSGLYKNNSRKDRDVAWENLKILLRLHLVKFFVRKTSIEFTGFTEESCPEQTLLLRNGEWGLFLESGTFQNRKQVNNLLHDSFCGCVGCWEANLSSSGQKTT